MLCGLAAVTATGSTWTSCSVPFQGPRSDKLPGVVTPRQRFEKLRELSVGGGSDAGRAPTGFRKTGGLIRSEKTTIRLEIIRTLGRYPAPRPTPFSKRR